MTDWRHDPDYQRTEQKFEETGNIAFAAIEIGRWHAQQCPRESKPLWAFEACGALYGRATALLEPVVRSTQGRRPYSKDYARVAWVANCHLNGDGRTARALFQVRLDDEGITDPQCREADLRRLLNYYGSTFPCDDGFKNRHVELAAKRNARSRKAKELGPR